jgi:hypothetical protein
MIHRQPKSKKDRNETDKEREQGNAAVKNKTERKS